MTTKLIETVEYLVIADSSAQALSYAMLKIVPELAESETPIIPCISIKPSGYGAGFYDVSVSLFATDNQRENMRRAN